MSAPSPVGKRPVFSIVLKILLVLLLGIGAFAGYVASKPDEFHIERSATIAASPEAVFAHIDNFHQWEAWSPWVKLDPHAQNSFEGPESGPGAVFRWIGNKNVGEGSMTVTESQPPNRVQIRLDFEKPMQDSSNVEFTLQPVPGQTTDMTTVTWAMSGRYQNFMGKVFCTIMNMEKMIGPKFEEGLASLKRVVESAPQSSQNPNESHSTDNQGS